MDETRGAATRRVVAATAPSPHVDPEPATSARPPTGGQVDDVVEQTDAFVAWLAATDGTGVEDVTRVDRIAAFERVKAALAAAQVRQTVAFAESQRAAMPSWTPERAVSRSIGSQVGLARHESPTRGDTHLALAEALTGSFARVLAALARGELSEAAAEGIVRATDGMAPSVRREVDARLSPQLTRLGERGLAEEARRIANAVDGDAASRRADAATVTRRVTLRSAADGMAYLTLLAPMAEATGAFRAVEVEAEATAALGERDGRCVGNGRSVSFWLDDSRSAAGHGAPTGLGGAAGAGRCNAQLAGLGRLPAAIGGSSPGGGRTRSQLMADVVIARLTGRAIGQPVPIEIQLVMTDAALHGGPDDHEPAANEATSGPGPASAGPLHRTEPAPHSADHQNPGHQNPGHQNPGHQNPGHQNPDHRNPGRLDTSHQDARSRRGDGEPRGESAEGPVDPVTLAPAVLDRAGHEGQGGTRQRSDSSAKIVGAGWLPAGFARELVRRTSAAGSDVTVRRVVTGAGGATVVGLEARRHRLPERAEDLCRPVVMPVLAPTSSVQRLFRGVLRRLVVVRDQSCRMPFCAAAIRAIDHVTPVRREGPTCLHNAEGTCVRCNLTKEAPGWTVVPLGPAPPVRPHPDEPPWPHSDEPPWPHSDDPPWQQLMDSLLAADEDPEKQTDTRHRSVVVTPTGHRYVSHAPTVG